MRVFVTGATGALGRHLVPALVAAGHEVLATTRTPSKAGRLREVGAEPVAVDRCLIWRDCQRTKVSAGREPMTDLQAIAGGLGTPPCRGAR